LKPGELVQSTVFDPAGSGGYGLILSRGSALGLWNVQWAGYVDECTLTVGSTYEVHETDVIVSSNGEKTPPE